MNLMVLFQYLRIKGSQKNEIKIIYDNKFIYVFAKAYTTADKVGEPSLKRDARTQRRRRYPCYV